MTAKQPGARPHSGVAAELGCAEGLGSVEEMIQCLHAIDAHVARLSAPLDRSRPVVLPAYGGTRHALNITPLLALLLRRFDVPVLVHGAFEAASGCTATGAVLAELGVTAATDIGDARARFARDGIAYVGLDVLAPPLAILLLSATHAGARTFAPLIDPFGGDSYRVVGVRRLEDLVPMRELLAATRANALLFVGIDGEPFADPRQSSPLEHFADGVRSVCAEADCAGPIDALPDAVDVRTTAEWTERALVGEVPLPGPLLIELGCCLAGARRSGQTPSRPGSDPGPSPATLA